MVIQKIVIPSENIPNSEQASQYAMDSDAVVITGMAATLPGASNIDEFEDKIYNKANLLSPSVTREFVHPEIPPFMGFIPEYKEFDVGYFGLDQTQIRTMDQQIRLLLEKTVEAIIDAGMHPSEFEGTNTGVYVGQSFSDSEAQIITRPFSADEKSKVLTGHGKFNYSHRLSYYLKTKGPSVTIDTACSGSIYALEHAYRAIQMGECDRAIVGGSNLCIHGGIVLQFSRLGVLSPTGVCSPFDEAANGYVRSEGISVVILQKSQEAKRIYAQVVLARTNCDGFKEEGITFPSRDAQFELFKDFYSECKVDPSTLSYMEAHGTGTRVGDPEECNAIDELFSKNRKEPLLIGSVKSSIGHLEAASGLASVVKCLLAFETGVISPNVNYHDAKKDIKGIIEGRMKVVSEKTAFQDDRYLIGVNSFGFGGANGHVLLKGFKKTKINNGLPTDNLPRLVCLSGRNPESVETLINDVVKYFDAEYIGLLHNIFRKKFEDHPYKGHVIISKTGEITRSIHHISKRDKPVLYIVLGDMDNWQNVLGTFKDLPIFQATVKKIDGILLKYSVNMKNTIFDVKQEVKARYSILGKIITQICMANLLREVVTSQIKCGGTYGELLSNYINEDLNLEEVLKCAIFLNNELSFNSHQLISTEGIIDGPVVNGGTNKLRNYNYDNLIQRTENNKLSVSSEKLMQKLRTRHTEMLNGTKKNISSENYNVDEIPNAALKISENFSELVILEIGNNDIYFESEYVTRFKVPNNLEEFLKILGSLYEMGYDLNLDKIYPKVEFPVSKGSPRLNSKILWNHGRRIEEISFKNSGTGEKTFTMNANYSEWGFISGHCIDGRILFPAAGYLYIVWKLLMTHFIEMAEQPITFEDCRFIRATTLSKDYFTELTVSLNESQYFEVTERGSLVATGKILKVSDAHLRPIKPSISLGEGEKLLSKDVYKELRLRGYNYSGQFQAIEEIDVQENRAKIRWDDNFITFLDNLFQMKIVLTDTRLLYVPTHLTKLTIIPSKHFDVVKDNEAKHITTLPAYYDPETDIISSGGIEVQGLTASPVQRKRYLATPVLEHYKFIPNDTHLDVNESVKVNAQIILENILQTKITSAELIDSASGPNSLPLSPILLDVLGDEPTIQADAKILSEYPLELNNIVVKNDLLQNFTSEYMLVMASGLLNRCEVLQAALNAIKENGYIISRESINFESKNVNRKDINILTIHRTECETLVLLNKNLKNVKPACINIKNDSDYTWLSTVQSAVKTNQKLVLFSENEPTSGLLGFVKCLRREPGINNVNCVLLLDQTQTFSPNNPFYDSQLRKNLAVNVYKNGQWGTYRHLVLEEEQETFSEHCYANQLVKGDMSTLKWLAGPIKPCEFMGSSQQRLVNVSYAALNYRDVMLASGKISADIITSDRMKQECVLGFEFSGIDNSGRRVMGITTQGALATIVAADDSLLCEVPTSWSLEEAATVPVVYGTIIYALVMCGNMRKGESVLIHSGVGGVGQAAIHYALHAGCTVFATVGNAKRKEYLQQLFPELPGDHIGNSHDSSFEQVILKKTKGRGVDMVINSLAEEKLLSSVRCLARGGRFLEIGKFDISSDNPLRLALFEKGCSFHGVMLDKLMNATKNEKRALFKLLENGIKNGSVKPLKSTVFQTDEIENAFRFMASGKHVGKVLIEIKKEARQERVSNGLQQIKSLPRYYGNPDKSYVIIGGLGGFGLELADWLVLRGVRKLVLVSRGGIKNGYQKLRLRTWKNYGAVIKISTANVSEKSGCVKVIEDAQELGPVAAIFNLAAILRDAIFENQTQEMFKVSITPKARTTQYFDEITRKMCKELEDFIVFSSVACGRGNAGQTNYGLANSVMEMICEQRRRDGYPALAIEWGAIGEVGLVADMQEDNVELEICGTLQQRISSCLQVMDIFLRQKKAAVVSSMVVAEKKSLSSFSNIVEAIASLLGVTDLKAVSYHATFAEMGMDSMTAIEIKQTLERDFEVLLTPKELRGLSFSRLEGLQKEPAGEESSQSNDTVDQFQFDMFYGLRRLRDIQDLNLPPIVRMPTNISDDQEAQTILMVPGIDGLATTLELLCKNIEAHVYACQVNYNDVPETMFDQAQIYLPFAEKILSKDKPFVIVAYSYGVGTALELVSLLELQGYSGTVICIDGSPILLRTMMEKLPMGVFEDTTLSYIVNILGSSKLVSRCLAEYQTCKTLQNKLDVTWNIAKDDMTISKDNMFLISEGAVKRIAANKHYTPSFYKIASKVLLFKPTSSSWNFEAEDYGLSELCKQNITSNIYEGDHHTIFENLDMIRDLNALL